MSYCTTKRDVLLTKIMGYYSNTDNIDLMLDIINGNSKLSLRVVDWFVTNYSKLNFTCYILDNGDRFKVYEEYKLNLKAYSKKQFDPFCRRERIQFTKFGRKIQTTIGQLNFFRWAQYNNIVEYVTRHNTEIELDMLDAINKSHSNSKGSKKNHILTTRKELSNCATKCFTCIQLPCTVILD